MWTGERRCIARPAHGHLRVGGGLSSRSYELRPEGRARSASLRAMHAALKPSRNTEGGKAVLRGLCGGEQVLQDPPVLLSLTITKVVSAVSGLWLTTTLAELPEGWKDR
jgi:hypothetical protein